MFCRNCGKEIQEEWASCPNCGEKIHIKEDVYENDAITEYVFENHITEERTGNSEIPKEQKTDFILGKTPISGKLLIKILSLIAITCFFCPLYMTSCAGQELIALDGPMLTFGFEYMRETTDGIMIFGLLAILPIISFICAFDGKKDSVKTLNYKSYSIAVCSCVLYGFITLFTYKLQSAMKETEALLKIEPCTALKVLIAVSLISAAIGGYLAFLTESREKETSIIIVAVKCVGKILGEALILLVIIMFPYQSELRPSTVLEDYDNEYEIEEAITKVDLSDYDMKDFIGESKETMEEIGFEDGVYDGTSVEYDEDDKVNQIYIEQGEETTPSFYGINIGMQKEEAVELLNDAYMILTDMGDEGFIRVNEETGEEVYCECGEGVISSILYCVLSDEELLAFQEENSKKEFIFPGSDQKYLSEDEVRNITEEDMAIGRNEIYARHGYIFQEEMYREYFESKSWYTGTTPSDQFNADLVFNDFEKKNVEMIKRIEDEVNGVTTSSQDFIGMDGVYICTTPLIDAYTGRIEIISVGNGSLQYSLGALEMPHEIVVEEAQIIDSHTAQANLYGYIITFTWSDAENMYVTGAGEQPTGMDSGPIVEITSGMGYIRSAEFNQY